jgi:hypothetical protein
MSDQTRRDWIVTIGQAAVGLELSDRAQAAIQSADQLPPGLYQPSADHLSHALMNTKRFHPAAPDCPTDYIHPRSEPFKPLFFAESEFASIRRLAGLLLGEVSRNNENDRQGVSQEIAEWIDLRAWSGGGVREAALRVHPPYRDLAVAYYGSARVKQLESSNPENTCREGLAWVSAAATAQYSKDFLDLEIEQQVALLRAISDERADKQAQNPGTQLFDFLKSETIKGFYTSSMGFKELDFKGNAFYAKSPGCRSK